MQQEHVNLNRLVADHLQSSREIFSEKVTVDFMSEDGLEDVCADPTQIGQVLTFLLSKAKSTMPNGGEITLVTRNVRNNPFMLPPESASESGRYVMLSVTETGDGTDGVSIDHIFGPCTSSGGDEADVETELSVVNRIVRKFNGGVKICCRAGEGTTFQIFLPSTGGRGN